MNLRLLTGTRGCIAWLFEDAFCDYSKYQLCFNVALGYQRGNYTKRVMRSGPDRFWNVEGQAPSGCVALSVSGNHAGAALEYHHVPARFLTPACPTARGQIVLVLRGALQGQFRQVTKWSRKTKKATISTTPPSSESTELPPEDICLAEPI